MKYLLRAHKRSVVALSCIHDFMLTQHCKDAKKTEAKAYRLNISILTS